VSKDKHVLVCVPCIKGKPSALVSYVDKCSECGAAVWHAFSSPKDDEMVVMCIPCAQKAMAEDDDVVRMPPTEKQINEVEQYHKRKLS
jgi:hypothetical protein